MVRRHEIAAPEHDGGLGERPHGLVHAGDRKIRSEPDRRLRQLGGEGEERAPGLVHDQRLVAGVAGGGDGAFDCNCGRELGSDVDLDLGLNVSSA